MITEYHRPATLAAAVELMNGKHGKVVPLAGGTILRRKIETPFAVMDLQDLPIHKVEQQGSELHIGAGVTLQQMVDTAQIPAVLRQACLEEASYNLRQMGTVGGCAAGAGGRSTLLAVLLAMNAKLILLPGEEKVALGNILPLRAEMLAGKLITTIVVDLSAAVSYQRVCKTPADQPLVGVAVCRWPSGRTRASVFGFGTVPALAMDGPTPAGLADAAKNACAGASDAQTEADYRTAMAGILAKRCLDTRGEVA
jgi:CO/xanthine dehydrogenase FAD-binding subunit